jgi:cysteinyl-tRNA synthetase
MKLQLFNTESREKETLTPHRDDTIYLYTCGPTIYNFAHIGNFRTYVAEDILRRTLKFLGYNVVQAMNLTDIDDKTIRGAIEKGCSLKEFTTPFREAFFADLQTLSIEPVEYYPEATAYIPQMIKITEDLLEKEIAYQGNDGSIYYSIRKCPRYGRLSHFCLDELEINASGENTADEYTKDSVADFALWKAYDPGRDGQIYWESPFGKGRPGWHIECSAMAMSLLGETIDLHCGGVDNMFPHHENEIAQSEGCSGKTFSRHWMHIEHLLVDHKKMSKSLGNFYTLRDLLAKGFSGSEVRYLLMSTHYRSQLNFTWESLAAARASLQRIQDFLLRLSELAKTSQEAPSFALRKAETAFTTAIADDLNISMALSIVFDLIREINSLADKKQFSSLDAKKTLDLFSRWNQVLAVIAELSQEEIPPLLQKLLVEREDARKNKRFQESDRLRDEILLQGYIIEDTTKGARLKKKS